MLFKKFDRVFPRSEAETLVQTYGDWAEAFIQIRIAGHLRRNDVEGALALDQVRREIVEIASG